MHELAELRVDLTAIAANLASIRSQVDEHTEIMPMLKADAYGHGLKRLGPFLHEAGIRWFGVAFVHEAAALREVGVSGRIVVFQPDYLIRGGNDYHRLNLDAVIQSPTDLERLPRGTRVHLMVDTGMNREGVTPDDVDQMVEVLARNERVQWVGLATHFACADEHQNLVNRRQLCRFRQVVDCLPADLRSRLTVHAANSGAIINYPQSHFDMVRPGIWLYGQYAGVGEPRQTAAMELVAQLVRIKSVQAGETIGYGAAFTTTRTTRVGYVCVGYGDGVSRYGGGPQQVMVHGTLCPVLGRVSMDQLAFDLEPVPRAQCGDEVVVLGGRNSAIAITADALRCGTIAYERCCQLGMRLNKRYVGP